MLFLPWKQKGKIDQPIWFLYCSPSSWSLYINITNMEEGGPRISTKMFVWATHVHNLSYIGPDQLLCWFAVISICLFLKAQALLASLCLCMSPSPTQRMYFMHHKPAGNEISILVQLGTLYPDLNQMQMFWKQTLRSWSWGTLIYCSLILRLDWSVWWNPESSYVTAHLFMHFSSIWTFCKSEINHYGWYFNTFSWPSLTSPFSTQEKLIYWCL